MTSPETCKSRLPSTVPPLLGPHHALCVGSRAQASPARRPAHHSAAHFPQPDGAGDFTTRTLGSAPSTPETGRTGTAVHIWQRKKLSPEAQVAQ